MKAGIAAALLVLAGMAGEAAAQPKIGSRPGPLPPGRRADRRGAPTEMLDRLNRMAPEERRRFFDNLPKERRQMVERRLEAYQKLSPQERKSLGAQFERFLNLPVERREEMRRLFRRFNQLTEDRRPLVRAEIGALRALTPEGREARLASDEFRSRYTGVEQRLIGDILKSLPEQE